MTLSPKTIKEERVEQIIEQLTRRKLEYSRQLLKSAGLPYSGNRVDVRLRLLEAVGSGEIAIEKLHELLRELDIWGQQRIRIGHVSDEVLESLNSEDAIAKKAKSAGMGKLLDGIVELVPPTELTPMAISYSQEYGNRILRLVAAKTRQILEPVSELPEVGYERVFGSTVPNDSVDAEKYSNVIYKPFKLETQKAIDFAEINLDSGLTYASTTLMRRGSSYRAEFKEFFQVFAPFIDLGRLRSMKLLEVNSKVCHLPLDEVTLLRHDSSSDLGGSLRSQSHGKKADVRNDQQLNSAHSNWPDSPKFFCNYEWQICEKLDEPVHTHIYAPEGEVAIYGQVKEKSVRYVLRRIRELA